MSAKDPFGLIGQVIDGTFRVDDVAGEGGFSVVYRGHHLRLGEKIAVKCLKLPAALGSALVESFMRRFRDEGKLLYRLSQGNLHIVRSIASGITTAPATSALVPYMVLEWLEGVSLAGDLEARQSARKTGRSLEETVKLLDTALLAVGYAHSQGVVHRDLNPGNIFLTRGPDGVHAKVLDFGVAKVVSDHAMEMGPRAPTFGQIRIFAPGYAAPEQFDTALGSVGAYTDVYTLAIVMLEVLTDTEVVRGENLGEFVFQTLNAARRPTPHGLGIQVGDAVNAVFAKATSLHPAGRPKDANELYSSLKEAMREDAKKRRPRASNIDKFISDDAPSPDTIRELRADNFKLTLAGTGDPVEPAVVAPPPAAGRPAAPAAAPVDFKGTLRMDTSALQDASRVSQERISQDRLSQEMSASRPQPTWTPAGNASHGGTRRSRTWLIGALAAALLIAVAATVVAITMKVRPRATPSSAAPSGSANAVGPPAGSPPRTTEP